MNKIGFSRFYNTFVECGHKLSYPHWAGNKGKGVFLGDTFVVGQFKIPANAELLESVEFKSNGVPDLIEQRYRLPFDISIEFRLY